MREGRREKEGVGDQEEVHTLCPVLLESLRG